MKSRTMLLCTVMLWVAARDVEAQDGLSPEARASLEGLRSTSGRDLSSVTQRGRLTWVAGLAEPTTSDVPTVAAIDFLRSHEQLFGGASRLEAVDVRGHRGTTYVRLEPRHLGLPVLGVQAVVSIRDGRIRHVASAIESWEGPASLPTTISATAAARAVESASGLGAVVPSATDLAWLPLQGRPGRLLLVWVVEQREVAPLRDWRYFVEATTGAVLWRHDQIVRADGYVYDTNPVTADGEVTRVELPFLDEGTDVLEGELARSFRCVEATGDCSWRGRDCRTCGVSEQLAVAQEDGNFLYEPDEPNLADPFAEVQGYYHASLINQFFSDVLGFERECGGSRAVTVYVNQHYPGDEELSANAGYGDGDGDGCGDLIMGEGLGIDFVYDAEVLYHEYSHAIIDAAGGLGCPPFGTCYDSLGLDPVPGGLGEGFADYFSVTFAGDPILGEHSALAVGGDPYIRTVDSEYMCPFDIIGEVHYDGQILGGLGWDIRQLVGTEVADRMMMQALISIVSSSGYAEVAAALLEAAQAELDAGSITEDELDDLEHIMGPEGRGVTDCERIVPLDAIPDCQEGRIPECHHDEYMTLFTYPGMSLPGYVQWSLTSPRRAEELRFELEDYGDSAGSLIVHVRRGEPVGVEMEFIQEEMRLQLDFTADASFDITRDELSITSESDPPLEDETTYYIALEYQCPNGCLLRARGEVVGVENQPPTAVAGEDQEVAQWDEVVLDGSASSDPEGDELAFVWEKLSGPPIELDSAHSAQATFVAEEAGTYEFELTVTDSEGGVGHDTVTVTVSPEPQSDAGPDGGGDIDGGLDIVDAQVVMNAVGGTCDCDASGADATTAPRRLLEILSF